MMNDRNDATLNHFIRYIDGYKKVISLLKGSGRVGLQRLKGWRGGGGGGWEQ